MAVLQVNYRAACVLAVYAIAVVHSDDTVGLVGVGKGQTVVGGNNDASEGILADAAHEVGGQ